MAQATKSDSAVSMANQLIALCGQAKALADAFTAFNTRNTNISPDTYWRLMATATAGTDGTIGTANGSPVLTNPITVGGINRAESDLLQGLTLAAEFIQFMNGTLPTARAQVNRLLVLDTLTG